MYSQKCKMVLIVMIVIVTILRFELIFLVVVFQFMIDGTIAFTHI